MPHWTVVCSGAIISLSPWPFRGIPDLHELLVHRTLSKGSLLPGGELSCRSGTYRRQKTHRAHKRSCMTIYVPLESPPRASEDLSPQCRYTTPAQNMDVLCSRTDPALSCPWSEFGLNAVESVHTGLKTVQLAAGTNTKLQYSSEGINRASMCISLVVLECTRQRREERQYSVMQDAACGANQRLSKVAHEHVSPLHGSIFRIYGSGTRRQQLTTRVDRCLSAAFTKNKTVQMGREHGQQVYKSIPPPSPRSEHDSVC